MNNHNMECPRCGKTMKPGWNFCPFCGFRPGRAPAMVDGPFGSIFNKLMGRLAKQMEEIDKRSSSMEKDFEMLDLSPLFNEMWNMGPDKVKVIGRPNTKGFSIKIVRSDDNEPKVDVKTFGDVDDNTRKQINQQLERMGISRREAPPAKNPADPKKSFPVPKKTEEPKATVKRVDSKVLVDIELPDVKSEEDIETNELGSSVEVRAMAGDKAYFKILTKPARFRLCEKRFENGKLHMEFA